MYKVEEGILMLRSAMFGECEQRNIGVFHPYSVRLPSDIASKIEVISKTSKLSKNQVVIDVLRLGFAVFEQDLEGDEAHQFQEYLSRQYAELDNSNSGEF